MLEPTEQTALQDYVLLRKLVEQMIRTLHADYGRVTPQHISNEMREQLYRFDIDRTLRLCRAREKALREGDSPWIDPNQRLPEIQFDCPKRWGFRHESELVLVRLPRNDTYTATYAETYDDDDNGNPKLERACWVLHGQDGYTLELDQVTGWMPIPK